MLLTWGSPAGILTRDSALGLYRRTNLLKTIPEGRSWRTLLRKSGMPSRSMLGAKPRLMYNTCEAAPTESVPLLRMLR